MSMPMQPPPPPPAAPPRKGLHPLAWVAIGCFAVLLVLGIGFVATTWWAANKIKSFAEKAQSDPDYALRKAAEWAVKMNPEVDLVSTDEAAGTMTIREKKSGKETTISFKDASEGKFSITTAEGEKVGVDFSGTANGGQMKVDTGKGTATFGVGADSSKLPDWVPIYPGATVEGQGSMEMGATRHGTFTMKSDDAAAAMIDYYKSKMAALGLQVQTLSMDSGGTQGSMLNGTSEKRNLSVTIGTDAGRTTAQVVYSENP